MVRLILLDRDGVINVESPDYIKTPDEWHPIPGSLQAVARLREAGHKVAVCTNQAGIARGKLARADIEAIHATMASALAAVNTRLDGLTYCPHHPDDACLCRKPEPGMLLEMMQLFAVDPEDAVFVGDSLRDAQAAQAAGCRGVLVRTGNGLQAEAAARSQGLPVAVFDDLASFTRDLLGGSRRMR